MSNWKEYRLGELYDFSSGLSKGREYFGKGYPFVSFKDIFYNYFIPTNLAELVESNAKERASCSVKRGDVFLTRTSETIDELGQSSVALKDYPNATFNGFTKRLRPKNADLIVPEFAGYYFRSPKFRKTVTSYAIMTTRASLNNEILGRLTIDLPPFKVQEQIGEILKSLDDKIELNNQINQELEALAQALFKQWFIDFEFPNENGLPYKSSGGKMIESELGEIPKGWKATNYGSITEQRNLKIRKYKTKLSRVLSAVMTSELVLSEDYFNKQVFSKSLDNYYVVENLWFAYNPSRINIGSIGLNKGEVGAVSPVYVVFSCTDNLHYFIENHLKIEKTKSEIIQRCSGTVRQALNYESLSTIPVIQPEKRIIDLFNDYWTSNAHAIIKLKDESKCLRELRDELLPKLISGELVVSQASQKRPVYEKTR